MEGYHVLQSENARMRMRVRVRVRVLEILRLDTFFTYSSFEARYLDPRSQS